MSGEHALPANSDTLLTISDFGNLLYQARAITQSLTPIGASKHVERTINGTLIDLSAEQFRKYGTKVTCHDVDAMPFDMIWPGMTVEIACACELSYPTGRSGSPGRPSVSGSSYVRGDFTLYRPVLTMLITDLDNGLDEWARDYKWAFSAEEV